MAAHSSPMKHEGAIKRPIKHEGDHRHITSSPSSETEASGIVDSKFMGVMYGSSVSCVCPFCVRVLSASWLVALWLVASWLRIVWLFDLRPGYGLFGCLVCPGCGVEP